MASQDSYENQYMQQQDDGEEEQFSPHPNPHLHINGDGFENFYHHPPVPSMSFHDAVHAYHASPRYEALGGEPADEGFEEGKAHDHREAEMEHAPRDEVYEHEQGNAGWEWGASADAGKEEEGPEGSARVVEEEEKKEKKAKKENSTPRKRSDGVPEIRGTARSKARAAVAAAKEAEKKAKEDAIQAKIQEQRIARAKARGRLSVGGDGEEGEFPIDMSRMEDLYGKVVWAKFSGFPWWPALVQDPVKTGRSAKEGLVPVCFFGSYDYAWVETPSAISDFSVHYTERARIKKKGNKFQRGLDEAINFKATGVLPRKMEAALSEPIEDDDEPGRETYGAEYDEEGGGGRGGGSGGKAKKMSRKRKSKAVNEEEERMKRMILKKDRKIRVMRHLGLAPPEGSPFEDGFKWELKVEAA